MSRHRRNVEIAPGQYKRIGRCTPAQRTAAAELSAAKAVAARACADICELLDPHLPAPIPEWLTPATERLLKDGTLGDQAPLLEFEQARADLEQWLAELDGES